ncbi:octopamine receptor 1-like [Patella vulgata]|uniref:octopamine receptor 1-like n=1 Tax=Patella vulgata TaxID=6465 RepID=UPI0024A929C8|nr:octopamine receptor 1-like [Patella vulgata]
MLSSLGTFIDDGWPFGIFWCYFVCAANYCLIIVSMMTLCFISIDRYIAIVHSLRYPTKITQKRVLCMIFSVWFQGISFSIVPVLYYWIEFDYWEVICAISWYKERQRALYYVIFAFILCFLLPGLVLAYCYYHVLTIAQKQHRRLQKQRNNLNNLNLNSTSSPPKYNTSSKAVKSLLVVVLAYFLCMTPFSCTKLYKVSVDEQQPLPNYMNLVASILAFCSSAVNPFIYGIFRKDFRRAYKKILWQILRRNSLEASTPNN